LSRIFDAVRSAEKRRTPERGASGVVVKAVEAPVGSSKAPQPSASSSAPPKTVATPAQQQHPPAPALATPPVAPDADPATIPADAIAVIGVTWEDDAAGRNPRRRLAEELKKQLTRVNFRHTDMRQATVYGNAAEDTAALQALRKKYRIYGRFCEFIFLGATSRAACAQFHINLKILELIESEALPERAVVLLQEPYFPGV
jgi:hypothetical protein